MHDELVDLVDRTGRVAHRGVWRSYVRDNRATLTAKGLYLPIAIVVVIDDRGHVIAQERGKHKSDGGAIDHVCGGQMSGEDIRLTAAREAEQEIKVRLDTLRRIAAGVNVYGRYRTLFLGTTRTKPRPGDAYEVERVIVAPPQRFVQAHETGDWKFVRGFFEDMHQALAV